jgi:NAD(P)-dependent dehydrogenase (short-subunit alcohol dehydrogenase family)
MFDLLRFFFLTPYIKNGHLGPMMVPFDFPRDQESSIYGIISAPDLPAYHASKGAVRLMTKTDALLYAKDGIRVNSVHPGYIWTPLVEELASRSEEGIEKFRENLASKHPVGCVGEPEDIAYGILYLASDEAKFVTGSELVIDGGYTAQ